MTWRTSLNFSVPQVPHLYRRANNSTYLIRFLSIQAVNLGKMLAQCLAHDKYTILAIIAIIIITVTVIIIVTRSN